MIGRIFAIFTESTQHFEGQLDGEKVVKILRRHPFIIISRLAVLALMSLVPFVLWPVFLTVPQLAGHLDILWFAASLYFLALWQFAFYLLTMFCLNVVIITNHRIIDSEQRGFFDRKISELHVERVQDVSVHTSGVINTLLHFGNIVVQTAASEKQFIFKSIANPESVKDSIMQVAANHHDETIVL